MQIDPSLPAIFDWLLRGGNLGLIVFAGVVGLKVNDRLKRDEALKSDYPPHRHFNGSILYPHEYHPTKPEHLNPH